MLLNEI